MRLTDYGRMVKNDPDLYNEYTPEQVEFIRSLPDEDVARRHLSVHPERWHMISKVGQRIQRLAEETTDPEWLIPFIHSRAQTNYQRRDKIETMKLEGQMLHELDLYAMSAEYGVPVDALPAIAVIREQSDARIREMQEQHRLQIDLMRHELQHAINANTAKQLLGGQGAPNQRNAFPNHQQREPRALAEAEQDLDGGNEQGTSSASGDEDVQHPVGVRRRRSPA